MTNKWKFGMIYFPFNSEKCNSWEPLFRKGSHWAVLRGLELDMQRRLISYRDLQVSALNVVVLKTHTIIPRQVRIISPNLLAWCYFPEVLRAAQLTRSCWLRKMLFTLSHSIRLKKDMSDNLMFTMKWPIHHLHKLITIPHYEWKLASAFMKYITNEWNSLTLPINLI